jgi:hypothetical protein
MIKAFTALLGCQSLTVGSKIHHIKAWWRCGEQEGIFDPSRDKKEEPGLVFSGQNLPFY